MNEIEYVFGTGDGQLHVWTSPAELELATTGVPDALRLDFDGDGSADDALWDSSGSGIADIAALDLDDDGVLDHFFTDPTGLGTWDHQITGSPADAASEQLDWIVRPGSADVPDHAATLITPQSDSPCDGFGASDGPAGLPDAPVSQGQSDSLPEADPSDYLAQAMSRDGRRFYDESIIPGVGPDTSPFGSEL